MSTAHVLAGVDGSEHARKAALWAVREAHQLGTELRLVNVTSEPGDVEAPDEVLREIAATCRSAEPGVDVTEEVASGQPVDVLLDRATRAQLVVVGTRGLSGTTEVEIGSVSAGVLARSPHPVIVTRGTTSTASGPVVVGIDGSTESSRALLFAVEAAARRNTDLLAILVWNEEEMLRPPLRSSDRDQVQRHVETCVAEQLSQYHDHSMVTVRSRAQHGRAVPVLTDASHEAQMLVVGHRTRGVCAELFVGSVAAGVVHHARCPVAAVPDEDLSR